MPYLGSNDPCLTIFYEWGYVCTSQSGHAYHIERPFDCALATATGSREPARLVCVAFPPLRRVLDDAEAEAEA